ncbi:MAG: hypothetical protein BGO01_20750 [Armatimonadetes bacterium 55-13]|nr:hypothetical protein [Armatimonadota bacterium]OJU64542.1 MAG: hypothetical protein BGO01_20750 [Armatimonadetes bacterium 55-13]
MKHAILLFLIGCICVQLCGIGMSLDKISKQSPAPVAPATPIVVLIPQDGRKPLLPAVAPLPDHYTEDLIAELKAAGLSDSDAAKFRKEVSR